MKKHNSKEIIKKAGYGAGAGVLLATFLRLPILGMLVDCDCPERGAGVVYGLSALAGACIGAINELVNQRTNQEIDHNIE